MAKKMGFVSERKAYIHTYICLLSECQFQTENLVVRGNTLHHTDGHRPGCYKDFAAYVGRTMRLRLEEEPLHR